MKSYLGITSRYLKVQKKRSILAIIGIILSVALITGIATLILSFQRSLLEDEIEQNGSYHAIIKDVDGEKAAKIKNHLNVGECSYMQDIGFAVFHRPEIVKGQPPVRYYKLTALSKGGPGMLPIYLGEGRFPEAPGEIAVDFWSLKYLPGNVKLGDTIELETGSRFDKGGTEIKEASTYSEGETFKSSGKSRFKIVGLLKPKYLIDRYMSQAITYIDEATMNKNEDYNVIVKADSEYKIRSKVEAVVSDMKIVISGGKAGRIVFNEKVLRLLGESANKNINTSLFFSMGIIMLLVVIATIAVIYNTFNISIVERITQFGLMRCVGSTPHQIIRTVITEAMILGSIGIPVGIVSGTFAMAIVFEIIKKITPGVKFATLNLIISPYIIFFSLIIGYLTVFLSVLLPALSAARVSPMEAVRNSSSFRKERFKKTRLMAFYKLLGVEGWVAVKNLKRNRKRFYITVFSMVISIVLFIVFGSFIDFYARAGISDKNENPSYSLEPVIADSPVQLTDEEYSKIKTIDGVQNTFKFGKASLSVILPKEKVNDRIYELTKNPKLTDDKGNIILGYSNIICYGDKTLDVVQEYLKSGKITAEDFDNGKSVIAVTSASLIDWKNKKTVIIDAAKLKAGDEIAVNIMGNGTEYKYKNKLKVSAILEYGILGEQRNSRGGIYLIVSEKLFKELAPAESFPQTLMIQMKQNSNTSKMKAYLDEFVKNNPDYQYMDYAQLAKDFKAQWLVICIFVYGFICVISLIGCLNIINSISTNIILRKRELSMMRAVGMTGMGIKRLICLESIIYGVIAAFIGSIVGSLLSRLLYNSVRSVRDFEWVLPVNFIVIGFVVTIFISIVAGFVPLKRINNGVIIDGIRGEE